MSSSTSTQDQWYQDAAASQIKGERMVRAELLNGRVAMLGFIAALTSYAFTGSLFFFGAFGI